MTAVLQRAACSTADNKSGSYLPIIGSYQRRLLQTGSGQAECFAGSPRTTNVRPAAMMPRQQSEQTPSSPIAARRATAHITLLLRRTSGIVARDIYPVALAPLSLVKSARASIR